MHRKSDAVIALAVIVLFGTFLARTSLPSANRGETSGPAMTANGPTIRRAETVPTTTVAAAESRAADSQATKEDAPPIDRRLDLFGIVTSADDRPLAGARVVAERTATRERRELDLGPGSRPLTVAETTTDERGGFRFRLRPGLMHDLRFVAQGYARESRANVSAGEFVAVKLFPGARVTGKVVRFGDESPVAGALVQVRRWAPGDLSKLGEAISGPDGVYTIDDIPPGRSTVEATHDRAPWTNGIAFDPAPGTTATIDLVIVDGIPVEGICRDAVTKEPIIGAQCSLSWTMSSAVTTNAEGRFRLENGDPRYPPTSIYVRAEGYGKEVVGTELGPHRNLFAVVEMRPSHAIRGRIVDSSGRPIEGVHVAAIATKFTSTGQWSDWRTSATDAEGFFRIDGLGDRSRHAVLARKEGYGERVYDLPAAELETELYDAGEIRLFPAATIAGVVVDTEGRHVARGMLEVSGCNFDRLIRNGDEPPTDIDGFDYAQTRRVTTDDLGRFEIPDLAEGVYVFDGGALEGRMVEEVSIPIKDGESKRDVRIVIKKEIAQDSFIDGIVVDEDGRPVAFPTVSYARNDSFNDYRGYNHFGADGKFRFYGLPTGAYSLEGDILFAGFDPRKRPYVATKILGIATGSRNVRLVMRSADKITGSVVGADDRPVPFATVQATDLETGEMHTASADIDGNFTLFVAEGSVSSIDVVAAPRTESSKENEPTLRGHLDAICAGGENVRIEVRP